MYSKEQICEKIQSVVPSIGECGVDVNVEFNAEENVWVIDLKKGEKHLKTFLEPEDANSCMEDKHCLGLGLQIHQLKNNIKELTLS